MSIFYNIGIGGFKGIEEQNQKKYEMIQQMVPLMQQTYLDSQDKIKRAKNNVDILNENLGVEATTAVRSLYKTQIDTAEDPISAAQTIIDNLGGINSENFQQIVAAKGSTEAPALTGQSKYDASKKFFEDNNIIGPAAFDLLNQDTMEASQQPMEGQQGTSQAMTQPTGDTAPVTTGAAEQKINQDDVMISSNIFGVSKRYKLSEHPYHGPLYEVWKNQTSAFAGTRDDYFEWLKEEQKLGDGTTQTNEQIYNSLIGSSDSTRFETMAAQQLSNEGGTVQTDLTEYIVNYQDALVNGDMQAAQDILAEAEDRFGVNLEDEIL